MFGGNTSTEYDEIVAKTTDENLTSENWELIMNLCDKVGEEGQPGAHAAIAAILKRLAHRNPNVQLYALSLSDSLGKNLGIEIHREIASKAFIQGLEKLITDRNTHEKVRRRALGLIAEWTADFESDSSLSIMEDCYNNLKTKNYKFEQPQDTPPPSVEDDIRRKEEEELQRVLEMSKQDRGGRSRWDEYSLAGPSAASSSAAASSSSPLGSTAPKYQGGYAPARTPSPDRVAAEQRQQQLDYQKQLLAQQQAQAQQAKDEEARKAREEEARQQAAAAASATVVPTVSALPAAAPTVVATATATTSASPTPNVNIVTRVRALYTFEPTEPGELAFEKGDVIKVVDRGYKDWWRGQLKGRTGIFPVNYVEPMPEPTAAELAKETEQEAAVFAQAVNVEKLLNMLRAFDPVKDNLADNEEIQELYRSSMALRPKIVKLIDKYSQKRADLVSMNETFLRARTIFDRMMEESLARHTGIYDQPTYRPPPGQYGPPILQGRPGSRNSMAVGSPQPFSWGPGYDQQQVSTQQPPSQPSYNAYSGPAPPFPSVTPQPLGMAQGQLQMQPQMQPTTYAAIPPQGAVAQQGSIPQQPQPQPQPQQPQPQVTATNPSAGYGVMQVGGYAGHQANMPYSQQGPTPYPTQPQPQQQPNLVIQQPQPQPQGQQPQVQGQPNQPYQPPQQLVQQPQPQPQPHQPHQATQQPAQAQPQPVQIEPLVQTLSQAQFQSQQSSISTQPQPEPQHQAVQEPVVLAQPLPQHQPQPEPQAQPSQSIPAQPISGPPPYPFDSSYTYADQNAQAWASYYAQGGTDPTGSVYFISVPGVKEEGPAPNLNQPSQQQKELNGSPRQSYATQVLQPEQQSPSQTTSYQAQVQPLQGTITREQSYQAQAHRTAEVSYLDQVGGLSNVASAVAPLQATANMPRYHLSDNPVPQSQPQGARGGEPSRAGSGDSASGVSPSSPTNFASTAPLNIKRAQSPAQTSSTPSWVLPKKSNGPGFGPHDSGGSPTSGGSHYQTVGSG